VDVYLECSPSAFKHGATESDIRHAYKTRIYDAALDDFSDKYALIGFDERGNPLEILYKPVDNDIITVFHAMKVRKTFLAELGL
jgi:hypothetical protein